MIVCFGLFQCLFVINSSISLVEKNGNAMLGILFIANTLVKYFYWLLWDNNIKPKNVHSIFWMLNIDYQKAAL